MIPEGPTWTMTGRWLGDHLWSCAICMTRVNAEDEVCRCGRGLRPARYRVVSVGNRADARDGFVVVEFLRGRMRFIAPDALEIKPNERPPFGVCLVIWDRADEKAVAA